MYRGFRSVRYLSLFRRSLHAGGGARLRRDVLRQIGDRTVQLTKRAALDDVAESNGVSNKELLNGSQGFQRTALSCLQLVPPVCRSLAFRARDK